MLINSKIIEIFSSIQGEGLLIGKRQIFIRFSGCNINCLYCDTENSKNGKLGKEYSYEELNNEIISLMTPDFHSLEITGGEPLLYSDYIKEFLTKYEYTAMLETNATLPGKLKDLVNVIDIVSMDIKLPEHFSSYEEWREVYENELESICIMEDNNLEYYLKIVVSPSTKTETIESIVNDLKDIVSSNVELVVQPVSPMSIWDNKKKLFTISEIIGKEFKVSIIPQIHKFMDIE